MKSNSQESRESEMGLLYSSIKKEQERAKLVEFQYREKVRELQKEIEKLKRKNEGELLNRLTQSQLVEMLKKDLIEKNKTIEAKNDEIEELKDQILHYEHINRQLKNDLEESSFYRKQMQQIIEQTKEELKISANTLRKKVNEIETLKS